MPPGIRGYTPPDTGISYDVAQARKLLAEAGFPEGRGFPKFGILYNTLEAHKKIAEVLADQLRRNLNIDASAYNQEWQSYLQSVRSLDYDIWRARPGSATTRTRIRSSICSSPTAGTIRPVGATSCTTACWRPRANVERFVAAPEFILQHAQDAERAEALGRRQSKRNPEAAARLKTMATLRLKSAQ